MTGWLSPYRVLDLTDARGQLAGSMLAPLGAEVIQVEPRRDGETRTVPPLDDRVRSFLWSAFGAGKRT